MFRGRSVAPGEPLFLPTDWSASLALAEEEAETCRQCGLPVAFCRDNETGRARFDVEEEFCWASYRVALRKIKLEKENDSAANSAARVHSAKFVKGKEPDFAAGLDL